MGLGQFGFIIYGARLLWMMAGWNRREGISLRTWVLSRRALYRHGDYGLRVVWRGGGDVKPKPTNLN